MTEYIDKMSVINRLIDLENEFQHYKPFHGFEHAMYRKICETEIAIGKMPAADVAAVRRGRWIYHRGDYRQECSCCHAELRLRGVGIAEYFGPCNENYCPNCGAKMEGWVIE